MCGLLFLFALTGKNNTTMLYYNFQNADEFKSIFGTHEVRKNKILLAFLKNKQLLHQATTTGNYTLIRISSLAELKKELLERIQESGKTFPYRINLANYHFGSSVYATDEKSGFCEDGDYRCVRYYNHSNNGTYKMKAGKFLRAIIMETEYGQTIGEQAIGYLCEEFARDWESYSNTTIAKNKLTVSKEFWKIYSRKECDGDFHSCMTNKNFHSFYENAVEASAAYLTNEEGKIVARCIIYDKVYDEDDKVWRLAERQYSTECSDILKRALVDALIREDRIDGYKTVGAGCNDTRNFVDIHGNSLSHKEFCIDCKLDTWDTCSYQDSFKYYSHNEEVAYNHDLVQYDYDLSITSGSIDGEDSDDDDYQENYDEYHECYTSNETTTVHYHGLEMECNSGDLEDFELVGDEWYHKDDISKCPYCGEWFVTEEGHKSELTGELYCDGACKINGEEDWKDENWFYSDYDVEYYEHEEDITSFFAWNGAFGFYEEKTISIDSYQQLFVDGGLIRYKGKAYDKINPQTQRPYDHATA